MSIRTHAARPAAPVGAAGFTLRPGATRLPDLLAALWASHGLILTLARKDFFVRYRRASLGLLWVVGLPLVQATVLAFVFSRVGRFQVPGVPYPVLVFSGMVGWSYFAGSMPGASTAIVDNSPMSSRVYFPRAAMPLVKLLADVPGLGISVAILVAECLVFRVHLGPALLAVIPASALVVLLSTAMALMNAALHVYFRDMRFLITALMSSWFFVTPVFYTLSLAPPAFRHVIEVNPVTGVVELFRLATVGADPGWPLAVAITCAWTAVLLGVALELHRRFDRVFTDLL